MRLRHSTKIATDVVHVRDAVDRATKSLVGEPYPSEASNGDERVDRVVRAVVGAAGHRTKRREVGLGRDGPSRWGERGRGRCLWRSQERWRMTNWHYR